MLKNLVWASIGLLLWIGGIRLRPYVIHPHPQSLPAVPAIDRPGLGLENSSADLYSYWTQNTSGVLAATVPAAYNFSLAMIGQVTPAVALANAATYFLIYTQVWFWNGAVNESARLLVQRPRPYVYADPKRADDPQNYTSFYSGHTSFTASSCVCLFLLLLGRGAPKALLLVTGLTGELLVISTAVFRVLAGRHFLTDTLTGAMMGTLAALLVYSLHRKPR
jgi:membrane-associated phospholipid phosphatase